MRHPPSLPCLKRISSWLVVVLVSLLGLARPAAAEKFPLAGDGGNVVGHLQGIVARI